MENNEGQLNPIPKRIAEGMSPLAAFLTDATCGEACWHAREEVCRCSCGGKNHGCLKTTNGEKPERTSKINGHRYILKAVGERLWEEAVAINRSVGPYKIGKFGYEYYWRETDIGAPARLKPASKEQLAKWEELATFKDLPFYKTVYLLWVKSA